jgi:hypothetical protein
MVLTFLQILSIVSIDHSATVQDRCFYKDCFELTLRVYHTVSISILSFYSHLSQHVQIKGYRCDLAHFQILNFRFYASSASGIS